MSDRNPPVHGKNLAYGRIREDLFDHVFPSVEDELSRLGIVVRRGLLKELKGKKISIEIRQVPDR